MRVLIGAAVGTFILVPAQGSAQDTLSVSCVGLNFRWPLRDVLPCVEQGSAQAQYSLGFKYANGLEVPEDVAEAERWYRLAAEQLNVDAQMALGMMYANGEGVPEDDAEAVRWYRLAAEQGDALGQSYLGDMYVNGDGVPEDLVLAYMWYNLSAAQDRQLARFSKEMIEQRMTREQIAEAQRLSREWIETHPQDGP